MYEYNYLSIYLNIVCVDADWLAGVMLIMTSPPVGWNSNLLSFHMKCKQFFFQYGGGKKFRIEPQSRCLRIYFIIFTSFKWRIGTQPQTGERDGFQKYPQKCFNHDVIELTEICSSVFCTKNQYKTEGLMVTMATRGFQLKVEMQV